MIVCTELRLLVTHVRKTGGSPVLEALLPWAEPRFRGPSKQPDEHGWQLEWHHGGHMHALWSSPSIYPWAEPLLAQQHWTHAATLRNPWERVESFYSYWHGGRDMDEFVSMLPAGEGLPRDLHPARAQAGPLVHHWLRTERLQEDLDALFEKLGHSARPQLKQRNVRPDTLPSYRNKLNQLYSDYAIKRVGEIYADDVALGNYIYPAN